MTVRALLIGLLLIFAAGRAALAVEPVKTARDLHIACGQTYEGFQDLVFEPVERSILVAQCYAFVTATAQLVRDGDYTYNGKRVWQCVDIPDELGELSDAYVEWIATHHAHGKMPAAVAFVVAIDETYPCKDGAAPER